MLGAALLGGCGGGLSIPDSHTSPGLGTLRVDVEGAGDDGTVYLGTIPHPTRNGSAYFYNLTPGRYTVTVSLPYELSNSENVFIEADKTRRISLSPIPYPIYPTPTPF